MTESNLTTPNVVIKAGGELVFNATGVFITLLNSTGVNGDLKAKLGNSSRWSRFNQYDKLVMPSNDEFKLFTIKNTSGADITAEIGLGNGDMQVAGAVTVANVIDTSKPSIFKTLAKVTIVNGGGTIKIMNSDTTTREVIIQNNDSAGNGVWLGDGLVSAVNGKGTFIASGATVILTTTANIYADNNSGANVDLNISYTAD